MMRVLLVEDDEFKSADLSRMLDEILGDHEQYRAASVTSALKAVTEHSFDLVVLDMSLPTFDLSGPGGGGSPQGQGGVEVLRLSRRLKHTCPFIVVTQYPDIEINGTATPVARAGAILSERFSVNVLVCVSYEFDSNDWRDEFRENVNKVL